MELLQSYDLNLRDLNSQMPINLCEPDFDIKTIPFVHYAQLFELIAGFLEEPDLAIRLADITEPSDLGMVGYLAINSPTLGTFCATLERYSRLFQNGASYATEMNKKLASFKYQLDSQSTAIYRQDIDLTLAMMIKFFRRQLGDSWLPNQVSVQYGQVAETQIRAAYFADRIEYDASFNGFSFDASVLNTPISGADPNLKAVLLEQANALLDELQAHDDVLSRLRVIIAMSDHPITLSADCAAEKFNITRRTLHRRLSEQGTSFQKLKISVVIQLAKTALKTKNTSITEIGMTLGYSENSAFTRAFKAETGLTPKQYRNQWLT